MMSPGAWWSSLGVVFDMQALGENLMKKFGAWWTGLGVFFAMQAIGKYFHDVRDWLLGWGVPAEVNRSWHP